MAIIMKDNTSCRKTHIKTKENSSVAYAMSRVGVDQKMIAAHLNMSLSTLRKHYIDDLSKGRAEGVN